MKILVDENLSKTQKFINDHPNLINAKDELGCAASDEKLVKYAKNQDYVIPTQNKGCRLAGPC